MVADIDRLNAGNDGRERSREEPWSTRAYGLLVFVGLAILVSLLALLCAFFHTWRLEEKLHGQVDHSRAASETRFLFAGEGM